MVVNRKNRAIILLLVVGHSLNANDAFERHANQLDALAPHMSEINSTRVSSAHKISSIDPFQKDFDLHRSNNGLKDAQAIDGNRGKALGEEETNIFLAVATLWASIGFRMESFQELQKLKALIPQLSPEAQKAVADYDPVKDAWDLERPILQEAAALGILGACAGKYYDKSLLSSDDNTRLKAGFGVLLLATLRVLGRNIYYQNNKDYQRSLAHLSSGIPNVNLLGATESIKNTLSAAIVAAATYIATDVTITYAPTVWQKIKNIGRFLYVN